MRILCLHGRGSNNEVLQMQTAAIRGLLVPEYEFEFVEGRVPHDEGNNWALYTSEFPNSQLYRYYEDHNLDSLMEIVEELRKMIEEHGPFDGVLGYSSGAFMAALLVIRSLQDNPFATLAELPLRFAIFINNGLTPPRVRLLEAGTTVADCDVAAAAATDRLRVISRPDNPSPLRPGRLPDGRLVLTDGKYYITHHEDCIISIPTLHIYGKADNMVGATELVDLCKPEVTLKMLHAFGHDFPHGLDAVRKIARLIRQTAAMAS